MSDVAAVRMMMAVLASIFGYKAKPSLSWSPRFHPPPGSGRPPPFLVDRSLLVLEFLPGHSLPHALPFSRSFLAALEVMISPTALFIFAAAVLLSFLPVGVIAHGYPSTVVIGGTTYPGWDPNVDP